MGFKLTRKSHNYSKTISFCSKYDFLSHTKMRNIKTVLIITQKVIVWLN